MICAYGDRLLWLGLPIAWTLFMFWKLFDPTFRRDVVMRLSESKGLFDDPFWRKHPWLGLWTVVVFAIWLLSDWALGRICAA